MKRHLKGVLKTISIMTIAVTALAVQAPATHSKVPAKGGGTDVKSVLEEIKGSNFRVAFDVSHGEIFSPVEEGPLNYSTFYRRFREAGAELFLNRQPVTSEALSNFDAYVIAGPTQEFTDKEIAAMQGYIHGGGRLLVLLHIASPVARLTEAFGVVVSNHVISEETDMIKGQSQDFFVSRFSPHPVTDGLKKIAVFGTWGLMADHNARVVAETSDKAWADLNRNRAHDKDEPSAAFGIVAVSEPGAGRVAVVADDAPFANLFIESADNKTLANNIIKWFKKPQG